MGIQRPSRRIPLSAPRDHCALALSATRPGLRWGTAHRQASGIAVQLRGTSIAPHGWMKDTARILQPGTTCAVTTATTSSGLLIDGRDYYRAVYDACRQAQRSILMLGWQFDSR